jgi:hypothetical protein
MLYEINYDPTMKISIVKGNSKLGKGVYAFNLLPGDAPLSTKDKGQLTNVRGTCGGCCDGCEKVCYAVNDARRYHNTCIPSLGKNTVIMRHDLDDMFTQLKNECVSKNVKILRYHSSGEIESYDYLMHMAQLAKELPAIKFYFYTKRFAFVERYLSANGQFPDNLVCNIPEWKGNTAGFNLGGLNVFVYDDGTDESLKRVAHCRAVDENGRKTGISCDKCGRCFAGNRGLITAVYSH